jgi:hypothetical protein
MRKLFNVGLRHARAWPYKVAALGFAGLAIYLLGESIRPTDSIEARFPQNVGLALFVSAIVALFLERLVHEALLADVRKATESLRDNSGVLRGATDLGIRDIVARRDSSSRVRCEERIDEGLRHQLSTKSGEILISCVAAPEYLRNGSKVGDLLLRGLSHTNCRLRVLLLCPSGVWAKTRAELEPWHIVHNDIDTSARFLQLIQKSLGDRVEIQCYDLPPLAFLLITDDLLFEESYPLFPVSPSDGPIGGKTPLLIFEKESESYRRWRGHFEFVWKNHSQPFQSHHHR